MKRVLLFICFVCCGEVFSQVSFRNDFLVYNDSVYVAELGENLQLRYVKPSEKYLTDSLGNVINGPYDYAHIGNLKDGRMAVMRVDVDGWSVVKSNDNASYMDRTGKLLMGFKYASCGDFHSGRAVVRKIGTSREEKCGYIDTTMKLVVPLIYDNNKNYYYGYAAVEKDGKWGVIDMEGKVVLPIMYDDLGVLYEGVYYKVKKKNKYGIIDINGNEILEAKYDAIFNHSLNDANVEVLDKGENVMFNLLTKEFTSGKYDYIFTNEGGLMRVNKSIFVEYQEYKIPSEGLMPVKKNGKWGYIDGDSNLVIPCIYDEVSLFNGGRAIVKYNGKEYVIDKKGNVVEDEEAIKKATERKRVIILS